MMNALLSGFRKLFFYFNALITKLVRGVISS